MPAELFPSVCSPHLSAESPRQSADRKHSAAGVLPSPTRLWLTLGHQQVLNSWASQTLWVKG